MPLIYGAENVSTELNNSKIRFRNLPVILIEKICSVVDIHWIKYERYSEISIKKYSRYPAGGLWFPDIHLYAYLKMVVLISWDCQKSEINNSMTLEV
jgi:hypothetical protein